MVKFFRSAKNEVGDSGTWRAQKATEKRLSPFALTIPKAQPLN
jgi:hypothetical protein